MQALMLSSLRSFDFLMRVKLMSIIEGNMKSWHLSFRTVSAWSVKENRTRLTSLSLRGLKRDRLMRCAWPAPPPSLLDSI